MITEKMQQKRAKKESLKNAYLSVFYFETKVDDSEECQGSYVIFSTFGSEIHRFKVFCY